mmetsp:Transcript_2888/g.5069  ORF Transcript_2888/g.5069 Transcript_2888/m.5069 type:complete len:208 (-) Transcript_2888:780-1403(-)
MNTKRLLLSCVCFVVLLGVVLGEESYRYVPVGYENSKPDLYHQAWTPEIYDYKHEPKVALVYNWHEYGEQNVKVLLHSHASKLLFAIKGCLCVEIVEENSKPLTGKDLIALKIKAGNVAYIPKGHIHSIKACGCDHYSSGADSAAEYYAYFTDETYTLGFPESLYFGIPETVNLFNYKYEDVKSIFDGHLYSSVVDDLKDSIAKSEL